MMIRGYPSTCRRRGRGGRLTSNLKYGFLPCLSVFITIGFDRVKVEGVAGEVMISGREVDCLVADNLPETTVAAIKVKGRIKV